MSKGVSIAADGDLNPADEATPMHPAGPTYRRPWGFRHHPGIRAEIEGLDARTDCARIVYLLSTHEFPFDVVRALELALFHTFGARRVAALLHQTGEFERRGQRRYDDTDILIGRFIEAGFDSPRGRAAIDRINAIHGRFRIANDDFLFVLWTFIDFPIDWTHRFGWRRFTPHEALAWFHFWREVGVRMGIRDIPATKPTFDAFVERYETEQMVPSAAARAVVDATLGVVKSWLPRPLRPAVEPVARALLRPRLLAAAGYPPAAPWVQIPIWAALRVRAAIKRILPLERYAKPAGADGYRSYPSDVPAIEEVGPPVREPGGGPH